MALNVFEPLKFSTQGITDLATKESLVVTNGRITVDTVEPKSQLAFVAGNFADLENKGVRWTDNRRSKSLVYKDASLWTDLSIDLAEEQEYKINRATVLSFTELGNTVTKSNLKQVGTLRSLEVDGPTVLGGFFYAASELNRVGINTDSPAGALGIVENNVELVLGSNKNGYAMIGTHSSDSLDIITDNTVRITVATNGDVVVHGKLYAEEIITERSSPVVFKETDTSLKYGKGLMWAGKVGPNNQFTYQPNPDRLWSTEIIDLSKEKYFSIDGQVVLSQHSLGSSVVESSLTKLGILTELQVAGDAAVTRTLHTSRIELGRSALEENRIEFSNEFDIRTGQTKELTIGESIVIGNSTNTNRSVSVYGNLLVGQASAPDGVSLAVNGAISFQNRKFAVGAGIPTEGSFKRGDIVWNSDPKGSDFIGWVCVVEGAPGHWLPFGQIATQ